jgi:NTP pyrophosphatase (non-canonical NTP hydrolase)
MQEEVRKVNEANGWFDSSRTFGDDIALLHSEVSEAFEAFRLHGDCRDLTDSVTPGDLSQRKPEGVGSELADVLVRLLDTCERYGIDLEWEFNRKILYNATRGYRHGNRAV